MVIKHVVESKSQTTREKNTSNVDLMGWIGEFQSTKSAQMQQENTADQMSRNQSDFDHERPRDGGSDFWHVVQLHRSVNFLAVFLQRNIWICEMFCRLLWVRVIQPKYFHWLSSEISSVFQNNVAALCWAVCQHVKLSCVHSLNTEKN